MIDQTAYMLKPWQGRVHADDSSKTPFDIQLHGDEDILPPGASLRFLSVVDTRCIPLHLLLGKPFRLTTSQQSSLHWLSRILLSCPDAFGIGEPWWRTACIDSPLGILLAVNDDSANAPRRAFPRVTELLLYASRGASLVDPWPHTPQPAFPHPKDDRAMPGDPILNLSVYALAVSSDLCVRKGIQTPPATPTPDHDSIDAVFLPPRVLQPPDIIHYPTARKRKSAHEALNEVHEQQRKARRKGGESAAVAGAPKTESEDAASAPTYRRANSAALSQSVASAHRSRPLSRSPSVASSRPTTARSRVVGQPRTSLSRTQSVSLDTHNPSSAAHPIETANKELISRIVLVGMRLYGFSQPKPSALSANEASSVDDFKLLYHQLYRSTCFTFRLHLATTALQPYSEPIRDVVEKLLSLFCCGDPLLRQIEPVSDKIGTNEITP